MTNAEKAKTTLEAAALFESGGGVKQSDIPQFLLLLQIAGAQAQVSIAESLERLADKHGANVVQVNKTVGGAYI